MGWVAIIAIYFVVWWTILFAVLPFGVRTQAEEGHVVAGSVESAPARPMLVKKAVWTSVVSAVIVFALWVAVDQYGLSVAGLADMFLSPPKSAATPQ